DGAVYVPIATAEAEDAVYTPDAIMDGQLPEGPVVIFDQQGYYMAPVIAEKLRKAGLPVTFVSEDDSVAHWGGNTAEGTRTRRRLIALGVELITSHTVTSFDGTAATLTCAYGGPDRRIACTALVPVTARAPHSELYDALLAQEEKAGLPFTLTRIGDCEAPGIVAQAVHAGHRYARETDSVVDRDEPLRHERVALLAAATPAYLDTLQLYYEEEIMGEAYFEAMAERFDLPAQKEKMRLLAEVERRAAAYVRPLIERHGLKPRNRAALIAIGQGHAAAETGDWELLLAEMRRTYPGYIDDFERLEAMAPPGDRPALALLTEHETAAIAFLDAESEGTTDSTVPLRRYIAAE
ncbi:MAG: hypothetical protein AAF675_17130, partial [Pseudomonadota bacterium]